MRRLILFGSLALLCVAYYSPAIGEDVLGRVVSVHDGDTITVLDALNHQHKIRLAEIDAPELHQAFGRRSQRSLAEMCAAKEARIEDHGRDRYGRTIGRVHCGGVDANREQVLRGMAWVFTRYVTDMSLYEVETAARRARTGLWSDANPIAPWQWRAAKRLQRDKSI